MQYERTKAVDAMIAKVIKKKDCTEKDAINYMLGVATGRLTALWRYDDKLPEGKSNLGVLKLAGKKKRAEKSAAIVTRVGEDKPVKPKAGKPKRKAAKRKTKSKPAESEAAVAAE